MVIRSVLLRALTILFFGSFAIANAQLSGSASVVSVNDWYNPAWGGGFNATFEYQLTDEDVPNGTLESWRLDMGYTGTAQLTSAWMSGFNGGVSSGNLGPNGEFVITNENQGYQPPLSSGSVLTFTIAASDGGFNADDFQIDLVDLNAPAVETSDNETQGDFEPDNSDDSDSTTTSTTTNDDIAEDAAMVSRFVSVNDWYNPASGGGFNATFECSVTATTPIAEVFVKFNYTGSGTPSSAWTQSFNGSTSVGFISSDGSYAISGQSNPLNQGDSFQVVINIDGAGFDASDFNVTCGISDNTAPTADAGSDISVSVGNEVTLDGSASTDPDGDPLIFDWDIVEVPEGSSASLSDPNGVMTSFVVDQFGDYRIRLVVEDGTESSTPDEVLVSTINSRPTADAGADQQAFVADEVILDGSTSTDADGDTLIYSWSLVSAPAGTSATLDSTNGSQAAFVPDIAGEYVFELVVSDGFDSSDPDQAMVNVETINSVPVADAGDDRTAVLGTTVVLSAAGSSDADGDSLTYQWDVLSQPESSLSSPEPGDGLTSNFLIDAWGDYVVQLTVNDGLLDSEPSTVLISTLNSKPVAEIDAPADGIVGQELVFDGAASSDPDGDTLSYDWSILSRPTNSATEIEDPFASSIALTTDTAGQYIVQLIVSDGVLMSEATTISIDISPAEVLSIVEISPPSNSIFNTEDPLSLSISLNQPASGTVGDQSVASDTDNTVTATIELEEGENNIVVDLQNNSGDSVQETVTLYLDTTAPNTPSSSDIVITAQDNGVQVTGVTGSVEPDSLVTVTNLTVDETLTTTASSDGAFEVTVAGTAADDIEVTVQDAAMNQSDSVVLNGTTADLSNASTIGGIVLDMTDAPIAGVEISAIDRMTSDVVTTTTSASDGTFELLVDAETEYVLNALHESYANQIVVAESPRAETSVDLTLVMADRAIPLTFNEDIGGQFEGEAGASVTVAGNSFEQAPGTDAINVSITPYDPAALETMAAIPGVLRAETPDGSFTELDQLGVVEIVFSDSAGDEIELLSDATATIRIPLYMTDSSLSQGDNATVWYLDENTGVWMQESVGSVVNSSLSPTGLAVEAEVSHFTYYSAGQLITTPIDIILPTLLPVLSLDSDGDGVPDIQDVFPNDPSASRDTDGDGVGDFWDAFPNDPSESFDSDGDGVGNNADAFPFDSTETLDSDNDGVGDNADVFPNDPTATQFSVSGGNAGAPILSVNYIDGTDRVSSASMFPHSDPVPPSRVVYGEIADRFSVNPLGGGNYNIPISLPYSPGGLTPELSLNYSTTAGEGLAGTGWSLNGLSAIRRCSKNYAMDGVKTRIQHDTSDEYCLDGQRLVLEQGTTYRTLNDNFQLIERVLSGGDDGWRVTSPDGTIYTYGYSTYSDHSSSNNGAIDGIRTDGTVGEINAWALASATDVNDNNFRVIYFEEQSNTQHYPIEFRYGRVTGAQIRVKFQYYNQSLEWPEFRHDTYAHGFKFTNTRRLRVIEVERGDEVPVSNYFFDYEINPEFAKWTLSRLRYCKPLSCFPAKTFAWINRSNGMVAENQYAQSGVWGAPSRTAKNIVTGDFDGDGRTDVIRPDASTCFSRGDAFLCNQSSSIISTSYPNPIVADFSGDGLDDFLTKNRDGEWAVCISVSNTFECETLRSTLAQSIEDDADIRVGDFNGDGRSDFRTVEPSAVFYYEDNEEDEGTFKRRQIRLYLNGEQLDKLKQEFVIDINGDGASDIVGLVDSSKEWVSCVSSSDEFLLTLELTFDFTCTSETGSGLPTETFRSGDPFDMSPGDFNADGLSDLVFYNRSSDRWLVYFSNGSESGPRFMQPVAIDGFTGDENNYIVADLNGDGRSDLVAQVERSQYQVAYGAAGHFHVVDNVVYADIDRGSRALSESLTVGDFDSDGRQDLANPVEDRIGIHLSTAPNTPILKSVVSQRVGSSPKTTLKINYSYTTHRPEEFSAYPIRTTYNTHVVRSSEVPGNRLGEYDQTTYDYDQLQVNRQGLGALGFNMRAETDERTGVKRTYFYHDKYPFVGRVNKLVTEQNGNLQEVKWIKYRLTGENYNFTTEPDALSSNYNLSPENTMPNLFWVYPLQETVHKYDYHTNTHVGVATDDYVYSFDNSGRSLDFGNVHIHKRTINDLINNTLWVDTSTNIYRNREDRYLKGLKLRSTTEHNYNGENSGGVVTKVVDYRYDDLGRLEREFIEPDAADLNGPTHLWTQYLYDGFGKIRRETTRGNTYESEPLPQRVTSIVTTYPLAGEQSVSDVALSEPVKREVITNAENQTMTVESELEYGLPIAVKDINGLITRYEYDEYGRKPKTIAPDGTFTHEVALDWVNGDSNAPANSVFLKKTVFESNNVSDAQQTPLTEYFDEHGNLLRTYQHRWHTDTNAVIVDYSYDRLSRMTRETIPYYEGQGFLTTVTDYVDTTNHARKITDYRGPTQDFVYEQPMTVERTDSDGYKMREVRNVKGQILLAETGDSTNLSRMTYEYDDVGRIRHIHDHDGHITTRGYNVRDFLVTLDDPDRGVIRYEYDSYGGLEWQNNARQQETIYTYDRLGRLTSQSAIDFQENRTYDTRPNGVGKLASVSYQMPGKAIHHRQTPSYDALSRLSQSVECIGAEGVGCTDFTTIYKYDDYSRLQLTLLPGGEEVFREYNNNILQRLRRGENGSLIWQMNNMDARGRPLLEVAGSGSRTHTSYEFGNNQGGMLSGIRVNSGLENILHRAYVYDPENALLESREDLVWDPTNSTRYKETFTYDTQRRISTSQAFLNESNGARHVYEYDRLGNITTKPDHPTTANRPYVYGQGIYVDGAGPHAVKSLGDREFSYDLSGNLLSDGEREASWTSFEKPHTLSKGSTTIRFEFGAGNNRTRRQEGLYSTWYLDGGPDVQIERLTHDDNEMSTKYHYLANGKVVAIDEVSDESTDTTYLHHDRLGSAALLTSSSGEVLERMYFDVWGNIRNITASLNSNSTVKSVYHTKGYTGHETLHDVDLVHMNGRVYDPIMGRFMSADPFVQFTYNSQSYNRYSYVLNNPMGATDPSGYTLESVDGIEEDRGFIGGLWDGFKNNFGFGVDPGIGNDNGLGEESDNDLGIIEPTGLERVYALVYEATGLAPSAEFINAAAGLGDELTLGISAKVREYLGVDNVDTSSPEFIAAATVAMIGTGPKGLTQEFATQVTKAAKKRLQKTLGCSFDGSMEVLTDNGYIAIDSLPLGATSVLAMDSLTGEQHWRPVLHHLWFEYDQTVYVTLESVETNVRQTIISNVTHPFFVKRVGFVKSGLVAVGANHERHTYVGPIDDGHWMQAADLIVGDLLLAADGQWAEVVESQVTNDSLVAYNLDVAMNDNFYVRGAGAESSEGVWVHNSNTCDPNNRPDVPNSTAAERAKNLSKGIPESALGPSGKPKINVKTHPTRKRAQEAAQDRSRRGGKPTEHSNPTKGEDPHFHPDGSKSREHHSYPAKGFPRNEEY